LAYDQHARTPNWAGNYLLLVALDHLRRCPDEISDNQFWQPDMLKRILNKPSKTDSSPTPPVQEGLWTG